MASLSELAHSLASELSQGLNDSICDSARLEVVETGGDHFFLGQLRPDANLAAPIEAMKGDFIPIAGHEDHLFLMAQWRFGPSSSGMYLKTEWSQFGLYVWSRKAPPVPFVRLEVDPAAWNIAHIQVHGESQPLGQIWGIRGERHDMKSLFKLHLPVGGFEYRPCLEDFIEFLIMEHLVSGKPQWRAALDRTRVEYQRSQLFSLIAKNPEAAREALDALEEE